MLYWLSNAAAAPARPCWEAAPSMSAPPLPPMRTPALAGMFSSDPMRISRRWAEARFANLVHFDELPAGGSLAALEQPALLAAGIRAAFRGLRA